jgi:hypothetical protein
MHRIDKCFSQLSSFIEQRDRLGGKYPLHPLSRQSAVSPYWAVSCGMQAADRLRVWFLKHRCFIAVIIRGRIADHTQTMMHDSFVAVIYYRFWQPFPQVHHHR